MEGMKLIGAIKLQEVGELLPIHPIQLNCDTKRERAYLIEGFGGSMAA
jgi:hypothetical protein